MNKNKLSGKVFGIATVSRPRHRRSGLINDPAKPAKWERNAKRDKSNSQQTD
jgi:hypothetical protein